MPDIIGLVYGAALLTFFSGASWKHSGRLHPGHHPSKLNMLSAGAVDYYALATTKTGRNSGARGQ
jgi:hypothetical protein